ncbi:MAG: PfkB family carbohydrate kinase [Solirubrobacteraceae bacterium]
MSTASERRVVVVGAINVDFVVGADRLPGPGETVVGPGIERHGGGKGANAAVAAARAGASVCLIGAVGTDDTAISALSDLREAGVDVAGVAILEAQSTGVALIVVDRDGENQIAVGAGANSAVSPDWVRGQMEAVLPGAGCVLVSTEIPGDAVAAAVESAAAAGCPCVLNTAPPIPAVLGLLEHGPVLTPNAGELAALTTMLDDRDRDGVRDDFRRSTDDALGNGSAGLPHESGLPAVEARARRLMELTGSSVVVTLGGDGACLLTPAGSIEHVAPLPVDVCDTTGAGDTFNGTLAARLAAGDELGAAVQTSIAAASLSVSHRGARAGMPQAAAIDAALRTN